MSGKWIVICGIDGSGKSKAIELITNNLKRKNDKIIVLRGMGTGEIGGFIREKLHSEYLTDRTVATACSLALLDCYDNIVKYLNDGYIVITDRFIGSYYAYNVRANKDLLAMEIFNTILNNKAIIDRRPDLTIYIDVWVHTAKERLAKRNDVSFIDLKPISYFNSVISGYYTHFSSNKDHNLRLISNNETIQRFNGKINEVLEKYLVFK